MQTVAFFTATLLLTADTSFALISVETEQLVNVECGQTATLKCSIETNLSLIDYSWKKGSNKLCSYNKTEEVLPGFRCENINNQVLVLTISQAQPSSSSTYTCSVMAKSGHGFNISNLHVSDCIKANTNQPLKAPPNHACAPGSKWTNFLLSFMSCLWLVLESGI